MLFWEKSRPLLEGLLCLSSKRVEAATLTSFRMHVLGWWRVCWSWHVVGGSKKRRRYLGFKMTMLNIKFYYIGTVRIGRKWESEIQSWISPDLRCRSFFLLSFVTTCTPQRNCFFCGVAPTNDACNPKLQHHISSLSIWHTRSPHLLLHWTCHVRACAKQQHTGTTPKHSIWLYD